MKSSLKLKRRSFVAAILVCLSFSASIYAQGSIAAWGDNASGKSTVPSPNINFTAVSAGCYHSLGLKADGSITAWGNNSDGQRNVPSPNSDFKAIAAGGWHSLGLKTDGTVVAWGSNANSECTVPSPNSDFKAIAACGNQSIGLKNDGSIVAWGSNIDNLLNVPSGNDFQAVTTGWGHALALKTDGSIVGWGKNIYGRLDIPSPNTDFKAIAAGYGFSLGLKNDGSIIAWGRNDSGELDVPSPNSDFKAIAAGYDFGLGLKNDGSIVGWGYNRWGQYDVPSPNADFAAIAAGSDHAIGLKVSNFAYGGGLGTINDPYLIYTSEQMNTIGAEPNDWTKCFKLMADINMSAYTGTQYNIIGNTAKKFKGKFDGNNHVIRNLTYNATTNVSVGLFGEIANWAEIKNVGLENVKITGNGPTGALIGYSYQSDVNNCYSTGSVSGSGGLIGTNRGGTISNCHSTVTVNGIGGLIGSNGGTVNNCYSTGNVSGWTHVGGLISSNDGTVNRCYASGNVSAENGYAGGLVADNSGEVNYCYSTGSVSGRDTIGGLIGDNSELVRNCYSTGAVSGVTHEFVGGLVGDNHGGILKSFWNNQTSGQTTGVGFGNNNPNEVFGKSTAQMKVISTFTIVGWDFTDETDNGTADIWKIADGGTSYPKLSWQQASNNTYKFGNIPGEKNTKVTVYDSCEPIATFSLTGGGYGEVSEDASQITLYGTGEKSLLTISTPKGKTATVASIQADGLLKGIMAKTTNLNGDIDIAGSLGTLTLNEAEGSISIGPSTNPKAAVVLVFGTVNDLDIESDMPIKSITAVNWNGGSIDAPSIGSITIKGSKKPHVSGDLDVDVNVDGSIGNVKVAYELKGLWECNSVKSITSFDVGHFSLTLKQPPDSYGKILALGSLTAKGTTYFSQILSAGNIGSVTLSSMQNSVCFAGVTNTKDSDGGQPDGVLDLPDPNTDITIPATIKSFKVSGAKGSTYSMLNCNIAAANILNAYCVGPNYSGSKNYGISADFIKSLTVKSVMWNYSGKNLYIQSDIKGTPPGNFKINIK
jgi:hypothetical protein